MKKIVIHGNKNLTGTVNISGAKNSVVALIPASILTEEVVEISNVPKLTDTANLEKIINLLEGKIKFNDDNLRIDGKNVKSIPIPEEFSNKLRASYYFMGALLGRFKHVEMNFPGGCNIGKRPIDQHLKGFRRLGATIVRDKDKYIIDAKELKGNHIYLDFPSVGATVNILLASVLAKGETIIENAAKEPEIGNLIELLNNMGAKIKGVNTSTLTIEGVEKLHGASVRVIPDRIETGTLLCAAAITGGNIVLNKVIPEHVTSVLSKLEAWFSPATLEKLIPICNHELCDFCFKVKLDMYIPDFLVVEKFWARRYKIAVELLTTKSEPTLSLYTTAPDA